LLLRPAGLAGLNERLALGGELLDGRQRRGAGRAAGREPAPRFIEIRHHPTQVEHRASSSAKRRRKARSRVWRCPASIATAVPLPMPDERSPSDADLLTAFRAGDSRAFEALVRRYQSPVLAIARRFARDPDDA